jgi:hypothetical protein
VTLLPVAAILLLLQEASPPSALERLRSPDAVVRREAERELAREGAKAVPALKKVLARQGDAVEPRVDALVARLGAASWNERESAGRALVALGRAAKARLATHENSADVEIAWRVKSILAELKELEPAEAAGDAVADAAICRLLGAAGDGASAGLLLDAMARIEGAPPEAALELRLGALEGLAALRPSLTTEQAERAAKEALKILEEPRHRRSTAAAMRVLERLKAPSAAKPLAAILNDANGRDLHVKRAALAALAAIDQPASLRSVIVVLKDGDPYLRESAAHVLSTAGGPDAAFDAAAGPAGDEVMAAWRAWWEKKYDRAWDAAPR